MELDNSRIWLYEYSIALYTYFYEDGMKERGSDLSYAKIIFLFDPDIMTNKTKIRVRIENVPDIMCFDDILKEKCPFLGKKIKEEFGGMNRIIEYPEVDTDVLKAAAMLLRITNHSLFNTFAVKRFFFALDFCHNRIIQYLKTQLINANIPSDFRCHRNLADVYEDENKQIHFATENDAKRAKALLDNDCLSSSMIEKGKGKKYPWILYYEMKMDGCLMIVFGDMEWLYDLNHCIF